MKIDYDIVVVGSGIAGLSFAIKCARMGRTVAIVTKKTCVETNTNRAQGGIASVTSSLDDFESHVNDTFIAGGGLCHPDVVRAIVEAGPKQIEQLMEEGVAFTREADGSPSLGREGGHSKRRILHVKDFTGRAIEDALLKYSKSCKNITTFEHHFAIDLITKSKLDANVAEVDDKVVGLYVLDCLAEKVLSFKTKAVMLSTGGSGCVYLYTTNPDIATGDGIAMAYRAGAKVANLEFIQFHPTALFAHEKDRFLISEAVRGEGGILRNSNGETFMKNYDARAELAPRDIVARAIDQEMKRLGSPHVWLDITHLDREDLKDRFPQIYEHCLARGIDISKDWMPVVPAAHYQCGGICTELDGSTNIAGLYACGEVACTGLHGANRLASNSLLEAVVVADKASSAIDEYLDKNSAGEKIEIPLWVDGNVKHSDERVVLEHNDDELRRTMWDYVGIVRTDKRLERALTRIQNLTREVNEYYWDFRVEPRLLELRNKIRVAELIIRSAMTRKESRGLHYTLDYPHLQEKPTDTILKIDHTKE